MKVVYKTLKGPDMAKSDTFYNDVEVDEEKKNPVVLWRFLFDFQLLFFI